MPPPLCRLMALLPLLASTAANAMSVGEIAVDSHLGEPLRARVPIVLDDEVLPGSRCARLVGPARQHPALAGAHIELARRGGQDVLAISTAAPIGDPMLDLTLRIEGCGPTLQKDYVIMLSPRQGETAMPASGPVGVPVATPDAPPAAARTPARRPPARRAAPPRPPKAAARKPAGPFVFRLDYDDGAFGQMAERIARERQAAYRAGEHPARVAPTPPPGDRLVLEPPPAETPPAAPAATAPGSAGGQVTAAPPAGKPLATAPASPASSWLARLLQSYTLLWVLLLILAAALGVAYWLKQRRPRSRFLDKTAPELETLIAESHDEDFKTRPVLQPVDEVFVEPPEAKTLLGEPPEGLPGHAAIELLPLEIKTAPATQVIETEGLSVEQHDTFDHVMELAEVMLAFGRSGQAIEMLSQHIRDNPRQSVDPWLKLLDLYFQSGLRTEFEALAANLHKYYNIAIIEWADYATGTGHQEGPLTLEALPHIMSRLTECWGTQAGLDYLNKLLADNRGGQRLGFSMPIVHDILLLRDILRQLCAVSASPR